MFSEDLWAIYMYEVGNFFFFFFCKTAIILVRFHCWYEYINGKDNDNITTIATAFINKVLGCKFLCLRNMHLAQIVILIYKTHKHY